MQSSTENSRSSILAVDGKFDLSTTGCTSSLANAAGSTFFMVDLQAIYEVSMVAVFHMFGKSNIFCYLSFTFD